MLDGRLFDALEYIAREARAPRVLLRFRSSPVVKAVNMAVLMDFD